MLKWRIITTYCLLILVTLGFLLPVGLMFFGSFKPDDAVLHQALQFFHRDAGFQNYNDVFQRVPFGRYFLNSLWITSMIVIFGLLVNAMAGYALARLHWPGKNLVISLVLALMIIPLEAIAVPLFYEVTLLGWRNTYWVQIVPFIANAFSIYLFYTFFLTFPKALEDAARIDGAGPIRIFFTIVMPNSRAVFATVAILTFLTQWSAFLWPLMVTHSESVRPLPLGIANFYTLPPLQWGDIFAFGVLMVAPVIIFFVAFQRWFVKGVATTGIKG